MTNIERKLLLEVNSGQLTSEQFYEYFLFGHKGVKGLCG
jgi:hypothetical protein